MIHIVNKIDVLKGFFKRNIKLKVIEENNSNKMKDETIEKFNIIEKNITYPKFVSLKTINKLY